MKGALYADSAIEASEVSVEETELEQFLTRSLPPRASRPQPGSFAVVRRSNRTKTQRVATTPVQARSTTASKQQTAPKAETARQRVRSEIATKTKPKRDAFLYHHRALFQPLLPESNYITKLDPSNMQSLQPHVEIESQPANITATLKPHQLVGLEFLVNMHMNAVSAVLGDEMGLGKTLQTLSLIQYLEEHHPTSADLIRPYLVVCPLSVLETWCDEAKKWTPKLKVIRLHGNVNERAKVKASMGGRGVQVVVTTYETFQAEQSWFKSSQIWRYVILDEGHRIKNDETIQSTALQGLDAEHRLLLTGTPLQNNLRELWALLHWLFPLVFTKTTSKLFEDAFDLSRGHVDTKFMDCARGVLELVMLRRLKSDPGVDLKIPPKTEILLYLPLTPLQQFWYKRLLTRLPNPILNDLFGKGKEKELQASSNALEVKEPSTNEASNGLENGIDFHAQSRAMIQQAIVGGDAADKQTDAYKKLMNLVMQLRKTCTHPYQIKGATPDPYYLGDHIMHASSKFIVLNKLVDELVVHQRKKIIIFSGFTRALDFCEDLLINKGANQYSGPFHYVRFDGSTARARRNLQVRLFNDPVSSYQVMLISTRAGGLGLNLAAACSDVIFLDEDWNPQVTLQAESRVHRIGQTKPVTIWKLLCAGSVEEQMMSRIRKKLYLSTKITDSMKDRHTSLKRKRISDADDAVTATEDDSPQLGASQLKSLIRRGAATLVHPEVDVADMVSWDLETIIEKCKDKTTDPEAGNLPQSGSEEINEEEWLAKMERVETSVYDGVRYQREEKKSSILPDTISRADRRVGKNTTVMVNGYAITKESMNCGDWEAVPTLAGKDPRLAEPKREKKDPIVHQDHCQVCFDGGELQCCGLCPRTYHKMCLPVEYRKARSISNVLFCPQHYCIDCGQNTSDVGGLLYRCRWCHRGSCEDCTDWTKTKLLGDTLPEYEVAGFHAQRQAWYIECVSCVEEMAVNEQWAEFVHDTTGQYERQYKEYIASFDAPVVLLASEISTVASTQDLAAIVEPEAKEIKPTVMNGNKTVHVTSNSFYGASSTTKMVAKPENEHRKEVENESLKHNGVHDGDNRTQNEPAIKKQKIEIIDLSLD